MGRILWLDDRIEERHNEVKALSHLGHDVQEVSSEDDAIHLLESDSPPDLVIQDLHHKPSVAQVTDLPARKKARSMHLAGWSFYYDVLRVGFPQVPVIIFTIDAFDPDNESFAEEFNLTMIRKRKGNLDALLQAVQTALKAQHVVLFDQPSPPSLVLVDFNKVNEALIRHLSKHPSDLHEVSWKTFEDLVATLLQRMNYEVWRTPLTRDGGVDIWAMQRSDLGNILYAIDAKKYAPTKVLGPAPVRAIHGVTEAERANVGMIVTTATFSPAARDFASQLRYRISLKEYEDVVRWIREVGSIKRPKDGSV